MARFDKAIKNNVSWYSNYTGYTGNPPTDQTEYDALDCWTDSSTAPTWSQIQTAMTGVDTDKLRVERDKKLAETDYWMFADTTTATQAQLDYRQALRDITDTYTSLDDVVWPTKP